jgi:hypothetical protein
MSNYQKGNKVRVKKDLLLGHEYNNGCIFNQEMGKLKGKFVTIIEVQDYKNNNPRYKIRESFYSFSDEMFEDIPQEDNTKPTKSKIQIIEYILTPQNRTVIKLPNGRVGTKKLNPSDTYNEQIALLYAMGRATGISEDKLNKMYDVLMDEEKIEFTNGSVIQTVKNGNNNIRSNRSIIYIFNEYEVGDRVSKEEAIEIIKLGGEIKADSSIYFMKNNELYFIGRSKILKSSGFHNLNYCSIFIINEIPQNTKSETQTQSTQKYNQKLWSEFINDKAVVNCETHQEAKEFLEYLLKSDLISKETFNIELNNWYNPKNLTCYEYYKSFKGMSYCDVDYYLESEPKQVIKFKDLKNTNIQLIEKHLSSYTYEELIKRNAEISQELSRRLESEENLL